MVRVLCTGGPPTSGRCRAQGAGRRRRHGRGADRPANPGGGTAPVALPTVVAARVPFGPCAANSARYSVVSLGEIVCHVEGCGAQDSLVVGSASAAAALMLPHARPAIAARKEVRTRHVVFRRRRHAI